MLYIIRHGRTDWNDQLKTQGQTDIPLNDEGRRMAVDAHNEYKDIHFDVCYCSPLVRARETARILLEGRDIPVFYDDRLKEMSFGIYEGVERCFEIPDCPLTPLFKDPENYHGVEGGETLEDLFERTGSFLREVVDPLLEEGKDILIVGHGAMNSCITCQVRNNPIRDFWAEGIENCKLKKLK